jgi:imidazolonepropionase-like amidohydrolase
VPDVKAHTRTACGRILAAALLAALSASPATGSASAPVTAIVGANVVYPDRSPAEAVVASQTIIIDGRRIKTIGPADEVRVPKRARVIDAHGKWVIPGLIDAHVHFFQSGNLYTRPDVADFNAVRPYREEVARNQARLPATFKVWLASGVTGVVDIGGPFWNFEVRDLARSSDAAPRMAVAGPLISMVSRPQLDLGDPPIILIESTEQARELVRRELARKPDYVKVWFIHRPTDNLEAQTAIVRAAADTAHGANVPLAVHATELLVAKAALRAGADFLVHSVFDVAVDEEFIALMRERRAIYCPTLFVRDGYQYALGNTWSATAEEQRLADPQILRSMQDLTGMPKEAIPPRVLERMQKDAAPEKPMVAMANLRALWNAGITVVMGTDAGNIGTLHGPSVFREMAYMQQSGLTPLEVLRTATTNGARALRMQHELGKIAVGKLADLVILDADPTADVANLSRAYRVIKDGAVYDPAELIRSIQ